MGTRAEVLIDGVDYNWVPITTDSGLDAGGSIAINFSSLGAGRRASWLVLKATEVRTKAMFKRQGMYARNTRAS